MMTAKGLAKLLEELGELVQVAAKRLAYFHTSAHPDNAGDLDTRMIEEVGDVRAACRFVARKFNLPEDALLTREQYKLALYEEWDADPDNGHDCFHSPALLAGVTKIVERHNGLWFTTRNAGEALPEDLCAALDAAIDAARK